MYVIVELFENCVEWWSYVVDNLLLIGIVYALRRSMNNAW